MQPQDARPTAALLQTLRVPVPLREPVAAMITLGDGWCRDRLDEEYAELTARVIGRLARKRPSPLARGRPRIWAAGVLCAVGQINYLFDACMPPHLRTDELSALTGVASSTMTNKAKMVRDLAGLRRFDPDVSRHDVARQCPDPFVTEVDGRIVDLATTLRELARLEGRG